MAKRHSSLIPLAQEHHEALLMSVRLQQGSKALHRLWSHDPATQAKLVINFFEEHLAGHFRAEEEVVFSVAGSRIPAAVHMVEELVAEHQAMKAAVRAFQSPDPASLPEALVAFGRLLESHIRKEDRILFPMIEEQLDGSELADIARLLRPFYPSHG